MALTAKLIELAAVALVMLFSTLRTMELISIYTSGRELTLLLLHVVCLIAAVPLRVIPLSCDEFCCC